MFRRIILYTFCTLCVFFSLAQSKSVQFTLLHSSAEKAIVKIDFPEYLLVPVNVDSSTMYRLQMNGAYPIVEAGNPELLETAFSLIIPEGSQPTVRIIASSHIEREQVELAPSKGRLYRNTNPENIPYTKGDSYLQDYFLKDSVALLGESYQLRDFTGIAIQVFPFAYNPVQKKLKAYSSITLEVQFNNTLPFKRIASVPHIFNNIYQNHFLNYTTAAENLEETTGDMLILAPNVFCEAMQPYADWKIKNGYSVEIVSLSNVGNTSSAIKDYITSYYETHDLAYLVLVGDNAYFPTIIIGGNISDNYYGEVAGYDRYPDIIIGKISAETVEQVSTQVEKFIQYEQQPENTNHFPVFCGIGSGEGPGDNNEFDYEHIRNIDHTLLEYTYTSGYEFFDGSRGELDDFGNPTALQVTSAINDGVGIINYCGHGAETSWTTSNFSNASINSLTNYNKLPFIFSVACLNGNYAGHTCFAETWLRANQNGQPTGAVGALMSVISQPWYSPMCAQDEMIRLMTNSDVTIRQQTFGGIVFNGLIKMLDNYNDYEVCRTWILFGDPALMVRTAVPQQLQVSHDQSIMFGTNSISFSSPVDNARINLSYHGEIIGQGSISNGMSLISVPNSLNIGDTIAVTAIASNYIPYQGYFTIIPASGPQIILDDIVCHNDINHDTLAYFNSIVSLDIALNNIGFENAHNIETFITSTDSYLTLIDSSFHVNALNLNTPTFFPAAYTIKVAENAPAYHTATISIHLLYNEVHRIIPYSFIIHSPSLKIDEIIVDDEIMGNGNQKMDFLETAYIQCTLTNNGNCPAAAGTAYITCPGGALELYRYPQDIPSLDIGGSYALRFKARCRVTTPTSIQIHFVFRTEDGLSFIQDQFLNIGSRIEDWESGDFSSFDWSNNTSRSWTITTQNPYEGHYALRSGIINNNSSSSITIRNTNPSDDTLSFYYKVSSEDSYDFLTFSIDGVDVENWSGEIGWTRYSKLIPAGTHIFKWKYAKDGMISVGDDMAMIDYISFPCLSINSGIEDFDIPEIVALPNPTTDIIYLTIPEEIDIDNISVLLYDLTGHLLHKEKLTSSTLKLSLGQYAQGMYLLKVANPYNILKTFKLIKQ